MSKDEDPKDEEEAQRLAASQKIWLALIGGTMASIALRGVLGAISEFTRKPRPETEEERSYRLRREWKQRWWEEKGSW